MSFDPRSNSADQLAAIVESARRLGVELDETDALQWMTKIAAWKAYDDVEVDSESGVFGHRIAMLDWSPQELAYYRQIGRIVELTDVPDVCETALALSGSSAQSKIQTYPGDCDYFERVNIKAPTRDEACLVLGRVIRKKALDTLKGENYQLVEVRFGCSPVEVTARGWHYKPGTSLSWSPRELQAGEIAAVTADGEQRVLRWDEVALDPGWLKLDWLITDPIRGKLAKASNVLDATWEAPDGAITPLDGYLDPYFQEVYLQADSIPIFSKLVRHVSADAIDDYVGLMEREVKKYLTKDVNYGKAAKRMYNVFRLTGRHAEAAYVRELFDEPTTLLYQVWSLLRAIDEACDPDNPLSMDQVVAQADKLILDVVSVLEGAAESEIVKQLLILRDMISREHTGEALSAETEAARQRVINVVNSFFRERMMALPEIERYMNTMSEV
ncbi:MAG: hypothetical protein MUC34_16875 [Anaerolineae bacterium]|jgi:hypothetical protein|nr:hypothetical protein [Anaerolineae bacterium]